MRIWGIGYTGATTRSRRVQANRLITDGPYAYLRNPLYVGNFLLSLGCCLIAWAWMPWMLVLFLTAFGLQYRLIVSLEEEELERIFGEGYRSYALHVPRFFPRWFPYQEGERVVPDFKKALQSERSTFATITGFLLLLFVRRILL
ncbi:MAG: isoprenylcysteine carboxylmethyltransferase family protein [Candidatus Latescibacteria bacterium]|nr:isoprenylcysteine carboxylmethyltransferase family protein [Candidatus Latescibacterota bacterium]